MQLSERIIEADALDAVADIAARHQLGTNLLLLCDDATWVAAGQQLMSILSSRYEIMPHSLGREPKASVAHVEPIIVSALAHAVGSLIAVGAGTINDIAKYAAHELGVKYLCVATAASMNGYSSANASLEDKGAKHSFVARSPCAVVADLRVLANAPKRLARAGLGDTLCRSTVEADRYLSHVLFGTPFERDLFTKLRSHEAWLIANSARIKEGSLEYLRQLITALLDAGDAMAQIKSSSVASQGEHMIAHALELVHPYDLREVLHGELIAVTTTTMAHLQHKILLGQPVLRHLPREEKLFTRYFGKTHGPAFAKAYAKKVIPEQEIEAINRRFTHDWPEFKAELLSWIVPANGIERAYKEAGLATTPNKLKLEEDRYSGAVNNAFLTRERFTFLDLAAMNARRA